MLGFGPEDLGRLGWMIFGCRDFSSSRYQARPGTWDSDAQ